MKKVIKGQQLKEYIDYAITLLSDTVKTTLGPNGNNVIINDSNFCPYITNDGVTIANSIEDENEIINTILSIIKEAALKTDNDVGDGTTTTIVLLEAIYKSSQKIISDQSEALKIKNDFQKSKNKILQKLNELCHVPTNNELRCIASVAANDTEIGNLITDFFLKLEKSNNIKIHENPFDTKDYFQKMQGYFIENTLASPYFVKDTEMSIKNPYIILYNKEVEDFKPLEKIIYDQQQLKNDLIILADNFSNEVINNVLALNYETEQKIILLNNPEYGIRKINIIDDLKLICQTKKVNDYFEGQIEEIKIDSNNIYFINKSSDNIKSYIETLKQQNDQKLDKYSSQFINDRISKLTDTFGNIYVGGPTKLERREKKMRFIDALCAINAAKDGILPGSSLPFYKISEKITIESKADEILANALKIPLIQILKNSGVPYDKIITKIKKENYEILFNAKTKTFESIKNTNVLDNKKVLEQALTNAISIASLLLTTSHLVINITPNTNVNFTHDEQNI